MKILFTGGGTAGHIFPIVAIIRKLKIISSGQNLEFFYVGPKDQFSESILLKEGVKVKSIFAGKIRRYFSILNIVDLFFKMPLGILQSFFYVFVISPDLIFSKGGYGSIPAVISGWILQTPIFLHESDAVPGLANRIAAKLSLEIFISFTVGKTKYFPPQKMISVGNPVRESIYNFSPAEAEKLFGLTGEKPIILILGGSQGAQKINDVIFSLLSDILSSFEVIHQTGEANFEEFKKETELILDKELLKYYHLFPFLGEKELPAAFGSADLIISRAGAGTIFEIAALGKPSILIPLTGSAQNHQLRNAYVFAERGATIVIEETNFTPHFILERIKYLFSRPQILEEMAKRAKEFSKPEAAKIIANYIWEYLRQ